MWKPTHLICIIALLQPYSNAFQSSWSRWQMKWDIAGLPNHICLFFKPNILTWTNRVSVTLARWQLEWDHEGHPERGVRLQRRVPEVRMSVIPNARFSYFLIPSFSGTAVSISILPHSSSLSLFWWHNLWVLLLLVDTRFNSSSLGVGQCGGGRADETSWREPQTGENWVNWLSW